MDEERIRTMSETKTREEKRRELLRMIKFTLFSISAGLVEVLSFTLFNEVFRWPYWLAYGLALVLSVIWNFTFNRRYTFQSAKNVPQAMAMVALYYAVFTPLSTWGGDALESSGWNEYLVLVLSMIVNFVTEFLYQRYVIYRDSLDTNDVAKKKNEAR